MEDKLCLLVVIGVDDTGRKELLAVSDGIRESSQSGTEVLNQLKAQDLTAAPKLAIGDSVPTKQWLNISTQPISIMLCSVAGSRPVVSVTSTII